jgi:hypothetical protein
MRYPASEKLEIIRLVEQRPMPASKSSRPHGPETRLDELLTRVIAALVVSSFVNYW